MRCHALLFLLLLFVPAAESRDLDRVIKPALIELDTEPPSWLFGTIHLPDPRVTRLHPDAARAFEQADAVYTEVPMDSKSTMQMGLASLRSDGRTLRDVVTRATWQRLDERLKRIHPQLGAALLLPMKTWAVYGGLLLFESQMQHSDLRPLDWQLYRKAVEAGKAVGGLEQVRHGRLRDEVAAARVDGEHAVEHLHRRVQQPGHAQGAGVVHHDVDRAQLRLRQVEELRHHRRVAQVRLDCFHPASVLANGGENVIRVL